MTKKYELIAVTPQLYQIKALRDIPRHGIKKGDLGGYIANADNLSQEGDCWVSRRSRIEDQARVYGNALIFAALLSGKAEAYDNAYVTGLAHITDNVKVYENAKITDGDTYGAIISGDLRICGNAKVTQSISGDEIIADHRYAYPPRKYDPKEYEW